MARRTVALARPMPVFMPRHTAPLARPRRTSVAIAKLKARASAAASRARRVAYEERHQLSSVAAAAALGLARRFAPDVFARLAVGPLDPEAVLGIAGFVAQRMGVRNEWVRHGTTAMLSVAAYRLAQTIGGGSVSGDDGVLPPPPPVDVGGDEIVEGEV